MRGSSRFFGDKITTDHISPAGIDQGGLARWRLSARAAGSAENFNQYGTRRGNQRDHDARHIRQYPDQEFYPSKRRRDGARGRIQQTLASRRRNVDLRMRPMKYQAEGVPLVVFAGAEYGNGSSRDWAAKGTRLLGVRAVIAESFERISSLESRRHGRLAAHLRSWGDMEDSAAQGR